MQWRAFFGRRWEAAWGELEQQMQQGDQALAVGVQEAADAWLTDYNEYRPHDSLGSMPPAVFRPRVFNQEVSTSELST